MGSSPIPQVFRNTFLTLRDLIVSAGPLAFLAVGLLVLAAELINTAVEEVVDHISPGHDPRAKKAKDCGSACVALTAISAGVAWVVVLVG